MGTQELLILILLLAILAVVLRGMYVVLSRKRGQLKLQLEKNIPEYNLEELELRELPNGGARQVQRSFAEVMKRNSMYEATPARGSILDRRSSAAKGLKTDLTRGRYNRTDTAAADGALATAAAAHLASSATGQAEAAADSTPDHLELSSATAVAATPEAASDVSVDRINLQQQAIDIAAELEVLEQLESHANEDDELEYMPGERYGLGDVTEGDTATVAAEADTKAEADTEADADADAGAGAGAEADADFDTADDTPSIGLIDDELWQDAANSDDDALADATPADATLDRAVGFDDVSDLGSDAVARDDSDAHDRSAPEDEPFYTQADDLDDAMIGSVSFNAHGDVTDDDSFFGANDMPDVLMDGLAATAAAAATATVAADTDTDTDTDTAVTEPAAAVAADAFGDSDSLRVSANADDDDLDDDDFDEDDFDEDDFEEDDVDADGAEGDDELDDEDFDDDDRDDDVWSSEEDGDESDGEDDSDADDDDWDDEEDADSDDDDWDDEDGDDSGDDDWDDEDDADAEDDDWDDEDGDDSGDDDWDDEDDADSGDDDWDDEEDADSDDDDRDDEEDGDDDFDDDLDDGDDDFDDDADDESWSEYDLTGTGAHVNEAASDDDSDADDGDEDDSDAEDALAAAAVSARVAALMAEPLHEPDSGLEPEFTSDDEEEGEPEKDLDDMLDELLHERGIATNVDYNQPQLPFDAEHEPAASEHEPAASEDEPALEPELEPSFAHAPEPEIEPTPEPEIEPAPTETPETQPGELPEPEIEQPLTEPEIEQPTEPEIDVPPTDPEYEPAGEPDLDPDAEPEFDPLSDPFTEPEPAPEYEPPAETEQEPPSDTEYETPPTDDATRLADDAQAGDNQVSDGPSEIGLETAADIAAATQHSVSDDAAQNQDALHDQQGDQQDDQLDDDDDIPDFDNEYTADPNPQPEPVDSFAAVNQDDDVDLFDEDERDSRMKQLEAQEETATKRFMGWAGSALGKLSASRAASRARAAEKAEREAELAAQKAAEAAERAAANAAAEASDTTRRRADQEPSPDHDPLFDAPLEPAHNADQYPQQDQYAAHDPYAGQSQYDDQGQYDEQGQYDDQNQYAGQGHYDDQNQYGAPYSGQAPYTEQARYAEQGQHADQRPYADAQPDRYREAAAHDEPQYDQQSWQHDGRPADPYYDNGQPHRDGRGQAPQGQQHDGYHDDPYAAQSHDTGYAPGYDQSGGYQESAAAAAASRQQQSSDERAAARRQARENQLSLDVDVDEEAYDENGYSEVLVVNVMARPGTELIGDELLQVLLGAGLRFGEMSIFHRHAERRGGPVLFSCANAINPGTFDLNQISEFSTPGVCFFMTLPNVANNMLAFEQMLATAKHVQATLDAELKDDNRSVMTAQTIEHYRQRIRDFELHQLQMSRR